MTASPPFIIGAGEFGCAVSANPVIYAGAEPAFVDSGGDCSVNPALLASEDIERVTKVLDKALCAI